MFGLLFSPLRPLWGSLETFLKSKLRDQSQKLASNFKAMLNSTISDMAETVCQSFDETGIPGKWSLDTIRYAKTDKIAIAIHSFPVAWLASSDALAGPLAKRLQENVELGAARGALGVTDGEWGHLLLAYSGELLRLGIPYALEKIRKSDRIFYDNEVILAVAKGEAYSVHGSDAYHNLVKCYRVPGRDLGEASLGKARAIWNKRRASKYRYEKGRVP